MIHAYDGAAVSLIRAVLEAARGVCVSLSVRHKLAGALRVATARCRWCSEISEQSDAGTGLGPAPGEPRVRPRRLPARPDRRKVPNASPSGSTTPLQWHRRFPAPCAGNPRRAFEILWLERSCQPQGLFHTNTKRPDTTSGSKRSWAGEARGRASSDADHAGTAAAQGERMREIAGRPPARNEIDKRLEEGSA
jgi:hypothetical protein